VNVGFTEAAEADLEKIGKGDRVVILHILHGARDYEPLLFPDEHDQ
jgi:plasmid stabilization system protein ParE